MPKASVEDKALIEKVLKLSDQGFSRSEIGNQLGFTKNQICGLLNRLKKKMQSPEDTPTIPIKEIAIREQEKYLKIIDPPRPDVIPEEGLTLLELPNDGCKFSIGTREDGVYFFCGQKMMEKSAYCEKHHRKVYISTLPFYRKRAA